MYCIIVKYESASSEYWYFWQVLAGCQFCTYKDL